MILQRVGRSASTKSTDDNATLPGVAAITIQMFNAPILPLKCRVLVLKGRGVLAPPCSLCQVHTGTLHKHNAELCKLHNDFHEISPACTLEHHSRPATLAPVTRYARPR
jgi:hypothetical protein